MFNFHGIQDLLYLSNCFTDFLLSREGVSWGHQRIAGTLLGYLLALGVLSSWGRRTVIKIEVKSSPSLTPLFIGKGNDGGSVVKFHCAFDVLIHML